MKLSLLKNKINKQNLIINQVPEWVNEWLIYEKNDLQYLNNFFSQYTVEIKEIKGILNSCINYKCAYCSKDITSTFSRIKTNINKNKFTCLCVKCISTIRHKCYIDSVKTMSNGYVIIQKSKISNEHLWLCDWSKPIMLHRFIMSKHLNRPLFDNENVHHKDGDKLNNHIDNLELWSTYQPYGQRVEDKIKWARDYLNLYKNEYPVECLGVDIKKSPIKAVVFDMDGTIVDMVEWHYNALNLALRDFGYKEISLEEQQNKYNGLPTKEKLKMLGINDNELINKINNKKQEYTLSIINNNCKNDNVIIEIFKFLKSQNKFIAIASNSVRQTVELICDKIGIKSYCDLLISNEDVSFPKPSPEMYLKAVIKFNILPEETLSIEDGFYGKQAALRAGLQLLPIKKFGDLNLKIIKKIIN